MISLLGECKTSSEIVAECGMSHDEIRPHLVRLRHLGIIEPVAICAINEPFPERISYFDNLLWTLSDHGKYHDQSDPSCKACALRELLFIDNAGIIE